MTFGVLYSDILLKLVDVITRISSTICEMINSQDLYEITTFLKYL